MPAALNVDWEQIKLGCVAGLPYKMLASRFGVQEAAIRKRASRERWPIPGIIKAVVAKGLTPKVEGMAVEEPSPEASLSESRPATEVSQPQTVTDLLAKTWAQKAEAHRNTIFEQCHKALVTTPVRPPKDWKEREIADRMARKAAGLESGDMQINTVIPVGILSPPVDLKSCHESVTIEGEVVVEAPENGDSPTS